MNEFSATELADFNQQGFIIVRGLAPTNLLEQLIRVSDVQGQLGEAPIEYEASTGYSGSPQSLDAPGGRTIRRLQQAASRHPVYLQWCSHPLVTGRLRQLLGADVVCPLAHHNCVMMKDPIHSSDTDWHQDIRYWRYARPELISVQLALNSLSRDHGSLFFMPGTHRQTFLPEQFDADSFLDTKHPENASLLNNIVKTDLEPGDVVFFHCRTFHAALRNRSGKPSRSIIFTYRSLDNPPLPDSRSAAFPELLLH